MPLLAALKSASVRLGYERFPSSLLRYVIGVSILSPLAAVVTAIVAYQHLSGRQIVWALMLVAMATIAERFPLHLTHKTNIRVTAGVWIVMFLLLPIWVSGLMALVAVGVAQAIRRAEPSEAFFNTGQSILYVVADTYDALTTNRPYRDALSVDMAIQILEYGVGRQ